MNASGETPSALVTPDQVLEPFDPLRAEEESFLAGCYVQPRAFSMITGSRSALIVGESGSGKTALCQAIERHLCPPDEKPAYLVGRWTLPIPQDAQVEGTNLVWTQFAQIMDLIARALIRHLVIYPEDWQGAEEWVQDTLHWFLNRYLTVDLAHLARSLQDGTEEGRGLVHDLATRPVVEVLREEASPDFVAAELMKAVEAMGLQGVTILVDGVERWLVDRPRLALSLTAFLSTLTLFEKPGFSYKFLLPADLEGSLRSAGAVIRTRVDWYRLEWTEAELQEMVERRLAYALRVESFSLDRLAPVDKLLAWLRGCGGESPRGWLHTVRPFLDAYIRGGGKKLSEARFLDLQAEYPPRLAREPLTGQFVVGSRLLPPLSEGLDAVLNYLYDRRGRVCPRSRLYQAYMNANYPDREQEERLRPSDYRGTMDTVLWRLRQEVEPDPANPIFLITVKGRGVRLENAI
ncbi:MAG: hypothetical protein PVJ34_21115 [Anaerolineae bacterium]|jgi:hypothetical protein